MPKYEVYLRVAVVVPEWNSIFATKSSTAFAQVLRAAWSSSKSFLILSMVMILIAEVAVLPAASNVVPADNIAVPV